MRGPWAGAITGTVPGPCGRALRAVIAGCCSFGVVFLVAMALAGAQPLAVEEGAVGNVLQVLEAPDATEPPVIHQTEAGYIRFLGAPFGGHFVARESAAKSADPAGVAEIFLEDHGAAFGVVSPAAVFQRDKVLGHAGSSFVRLNQYYNDLPVFGAQVVIQVDAGLGIQNIMSDIMRDTRALDGGAVPLEPALSATQALDRAKRYFASTSSAHAAGDYHALGEGSLTIFRPQVLGIDGQTKLVWELRLVAGGAEAFDSVVLVDAQSGEVVFHYSLLEHAIDRQIFDANGSVTVPSEPTRAEGEGPSGIPAVDDTYEFLGDTYNFFLEEHNWDSFDGNGSTIMATVNVPFLNACWGCSLDPGRTTEELGTVTEMLFGTGFNVDDIVAHEFTHGVTQFTSGLIYFGFSGAINESFSDMWGEWVDQTNGSPNDTPENRWIVGEDLDPSLTAMLGIAPDNPGIRNMKDPTLHGDPDRLGSPLLADVNSFVDNGGVHINSGIGNKLAYLLTDGDTFNGFTIDGMGVSQTADLFFGTQFLLSPSADYNDLFLALGASARTLGLDFETRLNIANAGRAVEIVPRSLREEGLRDFRAVSTEDRSGNPVIALSWTNPAPGLFSGVNLLRSPTRFPQSLDEGELLADDVVSRQFLDRDVIEGETYFYSLIADLENGLPQVVSTLATAGETASEALTESFGGADFTGRNAVDLSFSQLVFTPVGQPADGLGSFNNYEATFVPNAFALPVPREDANGRAIDITLPQDTGVTVLLNSRPIHFFGEPYSQLFAAANGYIAFQTIGPDDPLNFASLDSHFAIPRISYLFSGAGIAGDRLAASAGGSMWLRALDDRVALTYENVPQFNALSPSTVGSTSTVQVEIWYSGHIRITYLDAVATSAVIGLSDGRGVPEDPAALFPDVLSAGGLSDLSELPETNTRLSIEPVTPPTVQAGEIARFDVETFGPAGSGAVPVLTATWDGPGGVPFADNNDGTGSFIWQTTDQDDGLFRVRVTARADGQVAYQDVVVQVGPVTAPPEAHDLALITGEVGEDPTQDRAVANESSLRAEYTFVHPEATGGFGLFDEGNTVLYWYRNDQIATSLTNRLQVSPQATRAGDVWYFGVVPVTVSGLAGPIAFSPRVTISGIPEIVSVTPAVGNVLGGDTVRISGSRLSAPISVTFGGVTAKSVRAISAAELEVTTPLHAPGAVDVVVNTVAGPGILQNGFTYLGDGAAIQVTDVNQDGKIDALDVQLVVNAVLQLQPKTAGINPDVNQDGRVNAADIQVVVNKALHR